MPNITNSPKSVFSPQSEVNIFLNSLSKKASLSPDMAITLDQINTLEHVGLIPSKEALLIKNNLDDILFAEGILSDLILKLVKEEKLAPEMKNAVAERKLQGTILFLYTCHLEQTYSTLKPYIIQQQIWKCTPKEILLRMQEAEEMESKKYVTDWLQTLSFSKQECQTALESLLKPLTNEEFKKSFLKFIHTLNQSEEDLTHQLCLTELHELLKTKPEGRFFFTVSQFLKASCFYQNHVQEIERKFYKDHQFSLCLAADIIKNAPHVKNLPTYYHLLYGQIKKAWESTQPSSLKKPIVILEGRSLDEKAISDTIQKLFKKNQQPFYTVDVSPLKEESKKLIQSIIKKAPESLIVAATPENQDSLLEIAKTLHLPISFLPPHTEVSKWEETSNDSYAHLRIAFPTPLSSDIPEEINKEKTRIIGIPGLYENTRNREELKTAWGFPTTTKVVLIHTPEGDSPWPTFLAKKYSSSKDLAIAVLTDPNNKTFIHKLKTKVSPTSDIPIKIYTSLSSLEREELLTLSDIVIDKEREELSSLLFETSHAKTPLLLDNSPPSLFSGGFLSFLYRFPSLFLRRKESLQTELHEKLLTDQNLGIMIRSKENFKMSFEELLYQDALVTNPPHLADNLSSLIQEMQAEAQTKTEKRRQASSLNFFTTT